MILEDAPKPDSSDGSISDEEQVRQSEEWGVPIGFVVAGWQPALSKSIPRAWASMSL